LSTRQLLLEERAEQLAKPILDLTWLVESAVEKRLESLLRFRPRHCLRERVEGFEKPIGGWQRDLVDEVLRRGNRAPIEGRDPARECVNEAIQLCV